MIQSSDINETGCSFVYLMFAVLLYKYRGKLTHSANVILFRYYLPITTLVLHAKHNVIMTLVA